MNKLTKLAVCLALPLSGAIYVSAAVAASATTTFPVTASVIDSCTVAATPLAFGNYNGITALVLDATATITPTCTLGTAYTMTLDAGLGAGVRWHSDPRGRPYHRYERTWLSHTGRTT